MTVPVVASQTATEAVVTNEVSASQGAAISDVSKITGIFSGGLTDSVGNLVTGVTTSANLNTVTTEDTDINITVNDAVIESVTKAFVNCAWEPTIFTALLTVKVPEVFALTALRPAAAIVAVLVVAWNAESLTVIFLSLIHI